MKWVNDVFVHFIMVSQMVKDSDSIPGRTDSEIKNYWNTRIKRQLYASGIDPVTHQPLNKKTTETTDPPANSQVSEVAATSENGTDNHNQIHSFNVFLNSKIRSKAHPRLNLSLPLFPPPKPQGQQEEQVLSPGM